MAQFTAAGPASTNPPPLCELQRAHTPLRRAQFLSELQRHPDKAWVTWLLNAIDHGVAIGYTGPRRSRQTRNLASAAVHPEAIDKELHKELAAARILGPYAELPLPLLQCSGLGVVPKKGGKWRVIMHLSAPVGSSINDHISREQFSLQYASVDDAIRLVLRQGPGALMAKVDLQSAFRMVPVRREDWELLGFRWNGEYYVDTCLPFGLRSAPFLFNQFALALRWMLLHNYHIDTIQYLDDYFLTGPAASLQCQQAVATMRGLCQRLGIPIAHNKLEGPATRVTFLGIELDSVQQVVRLPVPKLRELLQEPDLWLRNHTSRSVTKRDLLSIIGKLAFAARVIPAGRFFLRRLIDRSTTVRRLHHHVRLDASTREDLLWWMRYLPTWNGTTKFLEPTWTPAQDLELFTDASGSWGFGAYFAGAWLSIPWTSSQQRRPIHWKELFAIVVAASTWAHNLSGRRIRFQCDNLAVVHAWQNKSAKEPSLLALLRDLFFVAAQHNFTVSLAHIPGSANSRADALSRNQLSRFFSISPQADAHPTQPPPGLLGP